MSEQAMQELAGNGAHDAEMIVFEGSTFLFLSEDRTSQSSRISSQIFRSHFHGMRQCGVTSQHQRHTLAPPPSRTLIAILATAALSSTGQFHRNGQSY